MKTLLKLLLVTVVVSSCSSSLPYSRDYLYYQTSPQNFNQEHYYFAQEYLKRLSNRPTVIVIEKTSETGTSIQPRTSGTRNYSVNAQKLGSSRNN
jgi:hypothetical protein